MPIDEFKLNLAFELTSKGEDFAAQGKYSDAVTKLKQALDIYNTCGLPETERIKTVEMINSQISEFTKLLNNSLSSSINLQTMDKETLTNNGLSVLNEGEYYFNEGFYSQAIEKFYSAVEILTQAGWSDDQLQYIQKIVQKISSKIEQEKIQNPSNLSESGPIEPYAPTFMQTKQDDIITHQEKVDSSLQTEQYTPSFLKLQNKQKDYITHHNIAELTNEDDDSYVPSYLKTDQDHIIPPEVSSLNSDEFEENTPKPVMGYTPTFMETDQNDVLSPEERTIESSQDEEPYMPTYIKADQDISPFDEFDSNEISQMLNFARKGITSNNQEMSSKNKEESFPSIKSSEDTPPFETVDQLSDIELTAQTLMDNFQQGITHQKQIKEEIFVLIDEIQKLEKIEQYNLAIAQLNFAINKINSLVGWSSQATVLFAWLLILKEKVRIGYTRNDSSKDFKMNSIKGEFTKIMQDGLRSNREITISFDKFVNQELNANQLFKTKYHNEKEIQNEVAQFLDQAQEHILNEKYRDALDSYNNANLLINKLNWTDLSNQLQLFISDLYRYSNEYDESLAQEISSENIESYTKDGLENIQLKQSAARTSRIASISAEKQKQSEFQDDAFSLISKGEEHFKLKNYDEAIENYEEAINLLIQVGWGPQIKEIILRINLFRREKEFHIKQVQESYYVELEQNEQEKSFKDEISKLIERDQDVSVKKKDAYVNFTQNVQKIEETKIRLDNLIDSAKQRVKNNQFNESQSLLDEAIEIMRFNMWSEQIPFINQLKKRYKEQELILESQIKAEKEREEKILKEQEEFNKFLQNEAQKIFKEQEKKQNKLEIYQTKKQQQQKSEQKAFSLMNQAEAKLKNKQFSEAIELIKKSNVIFREIGWNIDENKQLERVYKEEREYKKENQTIDQERTKQLHQQKQLAQQKKNLKETKKSALSDIKSLLSGLNKNIEYPPSENQLSMKNNKSSLNLGLTQIDNNPRTSEDVKKQENLEDLKAKKEMDEFKKMIREASKKTKKN